tara:strand:+ start:17099 stop:18160 length:1062 start_codon:yes stop_codon:yes gene_type:complete
LSGVVATSFAFHVTYTCPLTCAHCCFNSSPQVRDSLTPDHILAAIDALPDSIAMVAFTGGEPFLHGANLVRYVAAAHARGYQTRIVTSAYFASSAATAQRRLQPLLAAGLDELSISWDDFHEAFVAFSHVVHLCAAAVALGISVAINSVQSNATRWTAQAIRDQLGPLADAVTVVCESDLNLTGRAAESFTGSDLRDSRFLGPCPYVLTGPTLSARGDLLACCGVIPNSERLVIAPGSQPGQLAGDIATSLHDPLLLWLHLRGPYDLLTRAAAERGLEPPAAQTIGGNCEACRRLFDADATHGLIDPFLQAHAGTILDEVLLLDSLGLLEPRKLIALWARRPGGPPSNQHHPA